NPDPGEPQNPMSEPAVSAQDKMLMKTVRDGIMEIKMELCQACHERWFDLEVINDKCHKCRKAKKPQKYQTSNMMNPGLIPGSDILPPLSQIEEMIISPAHALVSLYQIRG
ncbi:hypothetical protein FB451DRAFT_1010405, partial [Mycena latifolia]